ncbi:ATP-binding protein [Actinacidiphila sp. DG2A-62]|uniref:ATP-binding protein n=1 Tax=Actinacidiphila sp. DG2A-62 TaxID=3108821 RepID=UPI002DBE3192|nr:ATP-binding protein [Actinacidiphila sp. DG2A-62]MEC3995451.1 ATP-binding protein [Actinacidiphila sp. DG2A-62]
MEADGTREARGMRGALPAGEPLGGEARERIVVGLSGDPQDRTLIRRAARLAARAAGAADAEILAVHVVRPGGAGAAAGQRALVEGFGGSYHQVLGDDVATALLDFARGADATQIVLGAGRRPGWRYVFGPGTGARVARTGGPDLDVHLVTHGGRSGGRWAGPRGGGRRNPGGGPEADAGGPAARGSGRTLPVAPGARLGRTRVLAGWLVGVAGPVLLTAVLTAARGPSLATDILLFLTLTVAAALLGGRYPALASAVCCSLLLNYYFTPPTHAFTIAEGQNVTALVVFVVVAVAVASVVDLAARRTEQAARLQAEAEILSYLAGSVLRGDHTLAALLERVRETFGTASAALWERDDARGAWRRAGFVAPPPGPDRPEDAEVAVAVNERLLLTLGGRVLPASDRRVLSAFAAQAAGVLDRQRLAGEAARARELAEGNRIRTALLAAVSHDLRTPLAGIKASVTSLRSDDVAWSADDEAELLAGIEAGADRLDHLIGNLLDMSRLQTGTVSPLVAPVDLDEVVPAALAAVPRDSVDLDIPEDLPMVEADPGLLERSVANVVENAVKYSPPGRRVVVAASAVHDRVELRVADRGPGVPEAARGAIFEPFQRHGDAPRGNGVGLGLAVARGFAESMGGTLEAEETPGGGLTMVLALRAAGRDGPGAGGGPEARGAGDGRGARGAGGGHGGRGGRGGHGGRGVPDGAGGPGAGDEGGRG